MLTEAQSCEALGCRLTDPAIGVVVVRAAPTFDSRAARGTCPCQAPCTGNLTEALCGPSAFCAGARSEESKTLLGVANDSAGAGTPADNLTRVV